MITILKRTIKIVPSYILFLAPSLVVGMAIWTIFVDGTLYYCSDKIPVLDFIPPFVHGSQTGDYWIADPKLVWSIWFLLIGVILISPYFLVNSLVKEIKSKNS